MWLTIILLLILLIMTFLFGQYSIIRIYYWMYKDDKKAFNILTEYDKEVKEWLDAGNKLKDFPQDKIEAFKNKWNDK